MNTSCLRRLSAAVALTILPRVARTQDSLPADIATFAREHGDAGVVAHVVGHLDSPAFTLFSAGSNVGVQAGGRIGWLRQPADLWGTNRVVDTLIGPIWFDLHPGDSAIAATAVDPRLAHAPEVQLRVWRTIVAQSPATTLATLLALLHADQTLGPAVATSPRLLETTSPVPMLIALAEANDQAGAIVAQNPALADHPRALAMVAEAHAAIWPDAMRRVLGHVNELAASGPIDERMAVHLVVASLTLGVDSTRAAVAVLPAVRRSAMARTVLAVAADTNEQRASVSEVGLQQLIGRIESDTLNEPWFPEALGDLLARSRAVRADPTLLWTLATLTDRSRVGRQRWQHLRLNILSAIARDRHAALEDLERVARALADPAYWQHPAAPHGMRPSAESAGFRGRFLPLGQLHSGEGLVAQMLYGNPRARGDRTVVEALATLPPSEFGSVSIMAARQLQAMSRRQ